MRHLDGYFLLVAACLLGCGGGEADSGSCSPDVECPRGDTGCATLTRQLGSRTVPMLTYICDPGTYEVAQVGPLTQTFSCQATFRRFEGCEPSVVRPAPLTWRTTYVDDVGCWATIEGEADGEAFRFVGQACSQAPGTLYLWEASPEEFEPPAGWERARLFYDIPAPAGVTPRVYVPPDAGVPAPAQPRPDPLP
ncbi:MAG: hypothetical protein R3F60_28965 [bacterium]